MFVAGLVDQRCPRPRNCLQLDVVGPFETYQQTLQAMPASMRYPILFLLAVTRWASAIFLFSFRISAWMTHCKTCVLLSSYQHIPLSRLVDKLSCVYGIGNCRRSSTIIITADKRESSMRRRWLRPQQHGVNGRDFFLTWTCKWQRKVSMTHKGRTNTNGSA